MTVQCGECGREIKLGERAYGSTAGKIEEDGFYAAQDEPWDTVICTDCDAKH